MPNPLANDINVVFRCASADDQFGELEALKALRAATRESGVAPSVTPGGGLGAYALEIALDLAAEEERPLLKGLSAVIDLICEERNAATQEATMTRRIDSRQGRLPGLVSSKPSTPQIERIPMDLDDVNTSTALPPINAYGPTTPDGRPGSRQFRYRPQPTGEGLSRVFACASAESLREIEAGSQEPFFGLRTLHDAVKAAKLSNPHRLVKMTVTRQWHTDGVDEAHRLPQIPDGRPPMKGARPSHVDAHGGMQKGNAHGHQGRPARLTTADRIARRFRNLQVDLDELQTLREMRNSHNQRLINAAKHSNPAAFSATSFNSSRGGSPNATMSGRTAAETSSKLPALSSTMSAADSKAASRDARHASSTLQGSRVRNPPPSAPSPTFNNTLTTRPATSLVDAVIDSVKRQQSAAVTASSSSGAADTVKSADGNPRAPVVPHRGVRASAATSLGSGAKATASVKHTVSGVLL